MSFDLVSDSNKYHFKLHLANAPSASDVTTRFLERPELKWGADDIDNESIFFPASATINFYSDYPGLFNYLFDKNNYVELYEYKSPGGYQIIFRGRIDVEEVSYYPGSNEYKITAVDFSQDLKKLPYDTISEYVGNNETKFVTTVIGKIVSQVGVTFGNVYGGEHLTAEADFSVNGEYLRKDFSRFGIKPGDFFDGRHETLWDALSAIVNNFGFVGYFVGAKFHLRFRFSAGERQIESEDLGLDAEIAGVYPYNWIVADVRTGGSNRDYYVVDNRDSSVEEKKDITLVYEVISKTYPHGTLNNLYIYLYSYETGEADDAFYDARGDTTDINNSGVKRALWKRIFDEASARIGSLRRKITAELYLTDVQFGEIIEIDDVRYLVTEIVRKLGEDRIKITAISTGNSITG